LLDRGRGDSSNYYLFVVILLVSVLRVDLADMFGFHSVMTQFLNASIPLYSESCRDLFKEEDDTVELARFRQEWLSELHRRKAEIPGTVTTSTLAGRPFQQSQLNNLKHHFPLLKIQQDRF
jgi:hypothetical protein